MAWLEEVINVLEAASVGTFGTDLFMSSKAIIPSGIGPYLSVRETGGTAPLLTQETQGHSPAYQQPTAQVVVRAKEEVPARVMIKAAYDALTRVQNQLVLNTWYLWIKPMQEPIDLGLDGLARIQLGFNVLGRKRPS